MDFISMFYLILFVLVILLMILAVSHASILAIILGLVVLIATYVIFYVIVKYSQGVTPTQIVEHPEHPLPLVGGICEVLDEVTPTKSGWVRYRGELWKAYSIRSVFRKGDIAYVVDVRGRFLIIESEPPGIREIRT